MHKLMKKSFDDIAVEKMDWFSTKHRLYTVSLKSNGRILLKDKTFEQCMDDLEMSAIALQNAIRYDNSPYHFEAKEVEFSKELIVDICKNSLNCASCELHREVCMAPFIFKKL